MKKWEVGFGNKSKSHGRLYSEEVWQNETTLVAGEHWAILYIGSSYTSLTGFPRKWIVLVRCIWRRWGNYWATRMSFDLLGFGHGHGLCTSANWGPTPRSDFVKITFILYERIIISLSQFICHQHVWSAKSLLMVVCGSSTAATFQAEALAAGQAKEAGASSHCQ